MLVRLCPERKMLSGLGIGVGAAIRQHKLALCFVSQRFLRAPTSSKLGAILSLLKHRDLDTADKAKLPLEDSECQLPVSSTQSTDTPNMLGGCEEHALTSRVCGGGPRATSTAARDGPRRM